jgi:predicted CoA-binding protein
METGGESCELPSENASPKEVEALLRSAKTIAVVGLSPNEDRPSHGVAAYMQSRGYKIIPVRPGVSEVLGEKAYPSLDDVPVPVDIVDVFRAPEHVPGVVDAAIRKGAKAVWLQEGVVHNEAAKKAKAAGLLVVQDRCILKAHRALPQ